MKLYRFGLMLVVVLGVSACSQKDSADVSTSPVMATVNGESITEADVDFMLERMLSNQSMAQVDEALRKKVLESLIASRAMKLQMQAQMTADESAALARTVKSYEEELYVKEYLSAHVTPEPVSVEMVQAYYEAHPEEFGAESVRDFQLLALRDAKDEKKRDQLLEAVAAVKSTTDWRSKSKELQQKYFLQFQEGRSKAGLLNPNLDAAISKLKANETSDLIYLDDQIYLARVTEVTQSAAKPLAEVSTDIRKKLAAQQLRAAVKKASEEVRTKVDVKIIEAKP